MLVVGLTGGIGSGKTTVTDMFAKRNVPIIDTDIIAHQLTAAGQAPYQEITKHFGQHVISKNGQLDRKLLRQIITTNLREKKWLEQLLHPAIREIVDAEVSKLSAPYCMIVIPLLYEAEKKFPIIDRVLVIDTSEALQIQRVMQRDHSSSADIHALLKIQATREQRKSIAHDVIINDGSLQDLIPQVDELHRFYLQLSN